MTVNSGQNQSVIDGLAPFPDVISPSQVRNREKTGTMTEEQIQRRLAAILVFALAIVLVFLVLAAQYESWTSPAAVILVVPLAVVGTILALVSRGFDNNVYTHIGIVLLIALGSKNAILVVDFAREQRLQGKSILEAARTAAQLRFRPILMTAISSIAGFMPLVIASGAGAASRQAIGTAVVGGMAAATVFSLIFTPVFYVVMQRLSETVGKRPKAAAVPAPDQF